MTQPTLQFGARPADELGTGSPGWDGRHGAVAQVSIQDLHVTKLVDANSPRLFTALANGEHFRKVTLTWVGPTGTPMITLLIEEVIVSSLTTGGATTDSKLTENLTFSFSKVTYSFNDIDGAFDPGR